MVPTSDESTRGFTRLLDAEASQSAHLQALQRRVDELGHGTSMSVEGMDQMKTLFGLTEEGVLAAKEARILQAVGFSSMHTRFDDIADSHPATYEWILEPDGASNGRIPLEGWLRQGSGIFHVAGKPGAGKSTLMKFVTEKRQDQHIPTRMGRGK
jgi:Cdc6-like AAA superfamily ATPase